VVGSCIGRVLRCSEACIAWGHDGEVVVVSVAEDDMGRMFDLGHLEGDAVVVAVVVVVVAVAAVGVELLLPCAGGHLVVGQRGIVVGVLPY